ncbi:MAG: hypothetical protein WCA79_16770 [Anaerolineales bacterium]
MIEVETAKPVQDLAPLQSLSGVKEVIQEKTLIKITMQGSINIVLTCPLFTLSNAI